MVIMVIDHIGGSNMHSGVHICRYSIMKLAILKEDLAQKRPGEIRGMRLTSNLCNLIWTNIK